MRRAATLMHPNARARMPMLSPAFFRRASRSKSCAQVARSQDVTRRGRLAAKKYTGCCRPAGTTILAKVAALFHCCLSRNENEAMSLSFSARERKRQANRCYLSYLPRWRFGFTRLRYALELEEANRARARCKCIAIAFIKLNQFRTTIFTTSCAARDTDRIDRNLNST